MANDVFKRPDAEGPSAETKSPESRTPRARVGKIARLPYHIRQQVNQRLADGKSGPSVVRWLNESPEVKAIIEGEFGGHPLSEQNLSEWRAGGFLEWQAQQQILDKACELADTGAEMNRAADGRLTDRLATALAARYAAALMDWNGAPDETLERQLRVLHGMAHSVARLRKGEQDTAWLQLEFDRLKRADAEAIIKARRQGKLLETSFGDFLNLARIPDKASQHTGTESGGASVQQPEPPEDQASGPSKA